MGAEDQVQVGGDAFPEVCEDFYCRGMSLLDYFAAGALQGLIAHGVPWEAPADSDQERVREEKIFETASAAYDIAEAMVSEGYRRQTTKFVHGIA